jgi:hypothetical protein
VATGITVFGDRCSPASDDKPILVRPGGNCFGDLGSFLCFAVGRRDSEATGPYGGVFDLFWGRAQRITTRRFVSAEPKVGGLVRGSGLPAFPPGRSSCGDSGGKAGPIGRGCGNLDRSVLFCASNG